MWKVMLADDEPYMREGLQKLIPWQETGCELVFMARNGKELLEKMKEVLPDIVIVDVRMPVMGGLEVAAYIAEHKLNIPVIVLTAYADFQYARQAIQYKVTDYVIKTSALDEIPKALKRTTAQLMEGKLANLRMLIIYTDTEEEPDLSKFLKSCFEGLSCSLHSAGGRAFCAVLSGCGLSDKELEEKALKLREMLYSFSGIQSCIGISGPYHDEKMVNEVYDRTCEAMMSRMQESGKRVIICGREQEALEEVYELPEQEDIKKEQGLIQKVQQYIGEHFCSRLSLEDIAGQVHLNKSYLSRLYKQKTGENLFDAINQKRIKRAREYIEEQNHMIYEIAALVGFDDNAYFSRVFKKYTGMSPKEYERQVQERKEERS